MNNIIKHYVILKNKNLKYLCNYSVSPTLDKATSNYELITCKKCKEIMDSMRIIK